MSELLNATDPDAALKEAREATGQDDPPEEAIAKAEKELIEAAAKPFAANPKLRQRLIEIHRAYEQTIDTVSQDTVVRAEFSGAEADAITRSFREYIEENRDEITALQVLYQRPYSQRVNLCRKSWHWQTLCQSPAPLLDHASAVGRLPAA